MMTKARYSKLLSGLPKGGVKTLADKFGKSTKQIYNDLKNEVPDVLLAAAHMAKEEQLRLEKEKNKAHQIIGSLT